jgi:hypothetical protein
MSSELIGFENLPNAFIKEIDILDYSPKEIQIKVKVCVHENKDNPLWYHTENILTKLLRIGIIFSTDKAVSARINEGDTSPLSSRHMQRSIPKPSFIEDKMVFEVSFSKIMSKGSPHLDIYSFCYVDNKELQEGFGFSLSNAYYGPVKSDSIIENSNVVETTNAFLRSNGGYWPGPVHEHSGGFMIGSYHTDTPHESLTKITLPNTKIKDFRKTKKKQSEIKKAAKNFISDLIVSYNSDTDINALFMMNMKTVLKNNTKFGVFLERASEGVISQLVNSFKINMMTIQRQRVKAYSHGSKSGKIEKIFSKKNIIKTNDDGSNLRNTTRLERNGSFDVVVANLRSNTTKTNRKPGEIYTEELGSYKKISMIKELFFDYGKNIRTFQFNDYELTDNTPGSYMYKMDLQFTDPVYSFLVDIIANFKQSISEIKRFISFISRGNATADDAQMIQTLVDTYVSYYSYIYEISSKEKIDLSNQMFGMLNPSTASLISGKQFQSRFEDLYAEFLFLLDFDPIKTHSNKQRTSVKSKNQTTGRIMITKTFNKIVQPSSNSVGFAYFGQAVSPGMKVMSKRALHEQSVTQTSNNYDDQPAINSPDLDDNTNAGLNDTSTYSTAYWSPTDLKFGAQLARMGLDSSAPYDLINTTLGIRAPQQSPFSDKAKKEQTGVSVQEPSVPTQTQTEENTSQFVEASEIIGGNQEFVSYSEVADSYNVTDTQAAANQKFNDFYSGFQNTRTVTTVLGDTKKLSGDEAQRLPNQLKAVIHGQSTSTKTDYATSGLDLLANPKTKNYYEINNFSVQKLVYVDGFEMDHSENILLNKPIYKEMSFQNFQMVSKPVICFLQAYTNDKFNITDQNKVSVVDSFFILSDRDVSIPPDVTTTDETPSYNVQDVSYEFMNSNTVVQTNAPMTEQVQQVTGEMVTTTGTQSPTTGTY